MEYDYSRIQNNMERDIKKIVEFFKILTELVQDAWENIRPYAEEILELMEPSKEYKPINKIKHKPVKEIRPNKIVLLSKRLNTHYCRSNL